MTFLKVVRAAKTDITLQVDGIRNNTLKGINFLRYT